MHKVQRQDSIEELASIRSMANDFKTAAGVKVDHVHDKINLALKKLGALELRRSNRVDFPPINNGAKDIRQVRRERNDIFNLLDNQGFDISDQEKVADATRTVLDGSKGAEAFCGEHAYYMRSALKDLGIPSQNMTVVGGEAKTSKYPIDHAFLLYSDAEFSNGQTLGDHISLNKKSRYIIIDPWATQKISEFRGDDTKYNRVNFIHDHLDKVMSEVDSKYRSARSIKYKVDNPTSNGGPWESDVRNFYRSQAMPRKHPGGHPNSPTGGPQTPPT